MGRLFGTDGVRGVANVYPMTAEVAMNIGRALTHLFKQQGRNPQIIVGKDTRISGDMLEHALLAGICSLGGDAITAGVLPTPGVAFLSRNTGADAGIVISASHNPYEDNGIKIFDSRGHKLPEGQEGAIEELLLPNEASPLCPKPEEFGRVFPLHDAEARYSSFLRQSFPSTLSLKSTRVVLDCANGAASTVGPKIFGEMGAEVTALFNQPDGKNINLHCGSQYPEELAKTVVEKKAVVGFAFDGDGDRVIAVDEKGSFLTGDQMLALCAASLKRKGRLTNNLVVRTVMSNLGLTIALQDLGIESVLADVGDRAVIQEMLARGAIIGGEDSGHLIFLDHHTTGDGIITALQVLAVMTEEQRPLSELAKIMKIFPQCLINIEVEKREDEVAEPAVLATIRDVEKKLGREGRVLVRYSGTQNLCRVMVEGPTRELTDRYCRQIAEVVRKKLQ